jgi:hypothetical protein
MCFTIAEIKDLFHIAGVISAAFIGFYGLNTWSRQIKGNDRYSMSKKLLLNLYKVKEYLTLLRDPQVKGDEISEVKISYENQASGNSRERNPDVVYSMNNRWEKLADILSENRLLEFESQIVFKRSLESIFKELDSILSDLRKYTNLYIFNLTTEPIYRNTDELIESYNKLFILDPSNDPIQKRVNNLILKLEEKLKKYI